MRNKMLRASHHQSVCLLIAIGATPWPWPLRMQHQRHHNVMALLRIHGNCSSFFGFIPTNRHYLHYLCKPTAFYTIAPLLGGDTMTPPSQPFTSLIYYRRTPSGIYPRHNPGFLVAVTYFVTDDRPRVFGFGRANHGPFARSPSVARFFSRGAEMFSWNAEYFSEHALRLEFFKALPKKR